MSQDIEFLVRSFVFPLKALNISFCFILACMVSERKSEVILIFSTLSSKVLIFSLLTSFRIFFFMFDFSQFEYT